MRTWMKVLSYVLPLLVVVGAPLAGTLLELAPPEIRTSSSIFVAIIILFIALLIIIARPNEPGISKYKKTMRIAAPVCIVVGAGLFFHYLRQQAELTFRFPPGDPSAELFVKGKVPTVQAEEWRALHRDATDSDLVDSFGGIPEKNSVWTQESIAKAEIGLTFYYVLFVVAFASAVLCLLEGLLTTDNSATSRIQAVSTVKNLIRSSTPHEDLDFEANGSSQDEARSVRNRRLDTGIALITLAGGLLAIYPLKDAIDKHVKVLPNWLYVGALFLGLFALALGLLMLALLIATKMNARLREPLEKLIKKTKRVEDYDCRIAKRNELRLVHNFAKKFFRNNVSTLTQMKQWHKKNPHLYWLLILNKRTHKKTISKMVGYYTLIPLTERASALVEREELNGTLFTSEDIVADNQKPASIYIGAVAANRLPFRARGVVLSYLKQHVERENKRGVTAVYTRPVNGTGLELVERYNFSPVDPNIDEGLNRIYKSAAFDYFSGDKKRSRKRRARRPANHAEDKATTKTSPKREVRQPVADTDRLDVFISYAYEDKDAIARPLYDALIANGITVWFDEVKLELGDSLRSKIDEGLTRCRYGIVILSPRFLASDWTRRELDGLVAWETASGEKTILPVLHELDAETLASYSPLLAGRLASRSSDGIDVVVEDILRVLRKNRTT